LRARTSSLVFGFYTLEGFVTCPGDRLGASNRPNAVGLAPTMIAGPSYHAPITPQGGLRILGTTVHRGTGVPLCLMHPVQCAPAARFEFQSCAPGHFVGRRSSWRTSTATPKGVLCRRGVLGFFERDSETTPDLISNSTVFAQPCVGSPSLGGRVIGQSSKNRLFLEPKWPQWSWEPTRKATGRNPQSF
jgi:hypothetical protein